MPIISSNTVTATLMLILPWPLLTVGLVGGIGTDRHVRRIKKWLKGASWFALIAAVLAAGTYSMGMRDSHTYLAAPLPARLGRVAMSVDVNGLTVLMLLLVALIGMVVSRYASTYLTGEPQEGRFHRWLSLTLGLFFMLISTGNLWGFLILWILTSLCLHPLLAFYRDRPVAVIAARKKYVLHRIADASLLVAFVLITRALHTSQFTNMAVILAGIHGPLSHSVQLAGGLIVVSALLKSAQFPFHGWLIQVMEAPTPVSALLHAGIIYTGTFLLLRMVPLMSRITWAGDVLIGVGLVSIVVASLMMMIATNIKGSLAYSTCAQMGFMLMECGLGLYTLAVLHITSHAVYKAHAFLSSGSVVDQFRIPVFSTKLRDTTIGKTLLSWVLAIPVVLGMGMVFGTPLLQQKSLLVMGFILTVSLSQLLSHVIDERAHQGAEFFWTIILLSVLVSASYFGLNIVFTALLGTIAPNSAGPAGFVQNVIQGLIIAVFIGLLMAQQMVRQISQHPFWQALYVHLHNDLYLDMVLTRWVQKLSPSHRSKTIHESTQDRLRELVP